MSHRLREIGNGDASLLQGEIRSVDDSVPSPDESSLKRKFSHCSFCGHPGSKRTHFKSSCEYCSTTMGEGCVKKSEGFKCSCSSCDMVHLFSLLIPVLYSAFFASTYRAPS